VTAAGLPPADDTDRVVDVDGRDVSGVPARVSQVVVHDAAVPLSSTSGRRVGMRRRPHLFGRTVLLGLTGALALTACDTAHSTQTGQVTAISPSSVCINPEDQENEPYCLDVSDPALLMNTSEGACVEVVGTLDRKLVRIETLKRACKVPRRDA
jgi:hypothetical protein